MTTTIINKFSGKSRFLSNFTSVEVLLDGVKYPSVEAAYQAAKTLDAHKRAPFKTAAAADAKKMGRRLPLRPDWEQVKLGIMEGLLRQKFRQEPFKTQLKATGTAELIEGNYWGDTYWGTCQGVGENHLGKLLMKIRKELR